MPFFRHAKLSAHGLYSSKQGSNSSKGSSTSLNSAKMMGDLGEGAPAYVDSVMTPDTLGNAEPLVLDFASLQKRQALKGREAPHTPAISHPNLEAGGFSDDDSSAAPPPPDFTRRDIHVPSRTSSNTPRAERKRLHMQRRMSSETTLQTMAALGDHQQSRAMSAMSDYQQSRPREGSLTPSSSTTPQKSDSTRARSTEPANTLPSSGASTRSLESVAPSFATHALVPLQNKGFGDEGDRLSPLIEDDPQSFDLVCAPTDDGRKIYSLETRSEQLFSREHLEAIFRDTACLLRFTSFLSTSRPTSLPTLIYYLDALKALRAISYANAVAEALDPIKGLDFTETQARPTMNAILEEKANRAFDLLVRDDLPAFITHIFVQVASVSISKRVTGALPPQLREASEGLAEVFCLTDPSRTDNPIIFASEEFHRTTQYGVGYAIGRNCRFLQGPKTNRNSVARFRQAGIEGKDHSEVFLNYRRDGSPFMNLLMMAPLLDSRGNLRYFIGAQIDVSGLVKDSTDLDAFQHMLNQQEGLEEQDEPKDEFQELSEMFNHSELDTVRKYGGNMHREHLQDGDDASMQHKPRLLIQDQSTYDEDKPQGPAPKPDGRLSGPYKHYLIVRPAPSLRILFTSPSLRVPGILQSRFLDRIGGNTRVRDSLSQALSDGSRGVTAKVRWLPHAVADLTNSYEEGRPRWIHCTPLLGQTGAVGVWMVVLVDEKDHSQPVRRFRQAPPVSSDIRSKRSAQTKFDTFDDDSSDSFSMRGHGQMTNGESQGYPTSQGPNPPRFMGAESHRRPASPRFPNSPTMSSGPGGFGEAQGFPATNGTHSARFGAIDSKRQPPSPRFAPGMRFDQRTLNSAGSSVKDYSLNRQRSTDSFAI